MNGLLLATFDSGETRRDRYKAEVLSYLQRKKIPVSDRAGAWVKRLKWAEVPKVC